MLSHLRNGVNEARRLFAIEKLRVERLMAAGENSLDAQQTLGLFTGFKTWDEAEIERFEATFPIGSKERLAFALLYPAVAPRSPSRDHFEGKESQPPIRRNRKTICKKQRRQAMSFKLFIMAAFHFDAPSLVSPPCRDEYRHEEKPKWIGPENVQQNVGAASARFRPAMVRSVAGQSIAQSRTAGCRRPNTLRQQGPLLG